MSLSFKYLFFLIIFITYKSWGATPLHVEELCVQENCFKTELGKPIPLREGSPTLATYKLTVNLSSEECVKTKNCYIFLGAVGDAIKITFNNHLIIDNTSTIRGFSLQDSTRIPLSPEILVPSTNSILIDVKDYNGTLFGLLYDHPFVGTEFETYKAQVQDWLLRTGITLFSAYTLLIFSITILLLLFINFEKSNLSIFLYCISATLYLISFSEYPRKFFEPEVLSGTVHFVLRLLQDLCLFITFHLILNLNHHFKRFFNIISGIYVSFILSFPMAYMMGHTSYGVAKSIIFIGAPLVAMPMGYAFFLSHKLPKGFERSLLFPITFVLFFFQIHDLLLFWQIIPSYFTVKFYIPLVVSLLLYIQARRYTEIYSQKNRLSEKVIIAKQVIHDIKSPVGVLGIIISKANLDKELKELADLAFERMLNLVKNLQFETSTGNKVNYVMLNTIVKNIVREKVIEYSYLDLKIDVDEINIVSCHINEYDFSRIISNIINNSVEARTTFPLIQISIREHKNRIEITIKDNGKGIPVDILSKVGQFGFTYGKNPDMQSSGIGLYSAKKLMHLWGGDLKILSQIDGGTSVSLIFPKKVFSKWFNQQRLFKSLT